MSSKSKIDDTTITMCKKYQNKLLWKKFTCTLLCSKARSSSCLAAAVSCWWVWRMCSMADAWRWFSSERRDAERRTRERDSVNGKTRLFQGDERLSGAELNIIHLQLSISINVTGGNGSDTRSPHLQFPVCTFSLCCFPVSSNYTLFQRDWAIIRAVDLFRTDFILDI